MNKILIWSIIGFLVIIVLVGGVSLSNQDKGIENIQPIDQNMVDEDDEVDTDSSSTDQTTDLAPADIPTGADPANSTYLVDGQLVTLVSGENIQEIPNSSSSIVTKLWTTTEGNLNEDSVIDAAVILEQTTGGTGIFYYVAGSINNTEGFIGTNAEYIGDRVAMETLEIRDMTIIVNYADRADGDSMSDSPSVGVSKYYKVDLLNTLVETDNSNL